MALKLTLLTLSYRYVVPVNPTAPPPPGALLGRDKAKQRAVSAHGGKKGGGHGGGWAAVSDVTADQSGSAAAAAAAVLVPVVDMGNSTFTGSYTLLRAGSYTLHIKVGQGPQPDPHIELQQQGRLPSGHQQKKKNSNAAAGTVPSGSRTLMGSAAATGLAAAGQPLSGMMVLSQHVHNSMWCRPRPLSLSLCFCFS